MAIMTYIATTAVAPEASEGRTCSYRGSRDHHKESWVRGGATR
jgi:hypothetical protein